MSQVHSLLFEQGICIESMGGALNPSPPSTFPMQPVPSPVTLPGAGCLKTDAFTEQKQWQEREKRTGKSSQRGVHCTSPQFLFQLHDLPRLLCRSSQPCLLNVPSWAWILLHSTAENSLPHAQRQGIICIHAQIARVTKLDEYTSP